MALRRVISSHLDLYDRSRRRSPRPAGDLHARSSRLEDIAVLISLGLKVVPLFGLLRLADQLLPAPLNQGHPNGLKPS